MLSKMMLQRTTQHAARLGRPASRAFVPKWSVAKPRRAFSTAASDV